MNVSFEEKKQEAIARMKQLGIFNQTIKQFESNNLISRSEAPFGACYWVEGEELESIRKFEAEYNALVYTVIRTFYMDGTIMDSYLYVSDHPEEWEDDWADINDWIPYAYVANYQESDFSEFGRIQVMLGMAGGLLRNV